MEGKKMTVEIIEKHLNFGGEMRKYKHFSQVLNCEMIFSLYLPPAEIEDAIPLIWWLSGLTCTDDNFSQKGGFQEYAAKHKVAIAIPDTSPRGDNIPDSNDWDLGQGASFYVDATQEPWAENYHMYTYITQELTQIMHDLVPGYSGKESIMGHSMGGHGALMIGLKNSNRFSSISAFAPILNPIQVPWGIKAFNAYLGSEESTWHKWDATSLIKQMDQIPPILITQGTADTFYDVQLQEDAFMKAAQNKPVQYEKKEGYDHSYFTISTFIGQHIAFHVEQLNK